MKITAVKAIMIKWDCSLMSDAISPNTKRQALLVKVETDTELYGIGEAFCYGSPLHVGKAILEEQLAPHIIGENPENIEKIWQTLYWRTIANGRRGVVMACISGIDIALWDLLGKALHRPVSVLLGKHLDKIPSYASGGFYAPEKDMDAYKKEVEGYVAKGYQAAKIKIGRNPDMPMNSIRYMSNKDFGVSYDQDMERIAIAREAFGKGKFLAADINAAWTSNQVLASIQDFKDAGLDCLEEPIVFEDREGCRKLAAMPDIQLMGFETEQGCKNFAKLIQDRMVDIVQPDIGWGGGISELKKIGSLAMANDKPISLHSFGSAVHFAASLQLAASFGNTWYIESEENPNLLKTGITKAPLEADDQMNFYVPDGDGLGIELDWDVIHQLEVQ